MTGPLPLLPGDHVIYLADPLRFGVLELLAVADDGTLWCAQLTAGDVHRFHPDDVGLNPELYAPADERRAA
jgi:sugar lactone lactonase YvrE